MPDEAPVTSAVVSLNVKATDPLPSKSSILTGNLHNQARAFMTAQAEMQSTNLQQHRSRLSANELMLYLKLSNPASKTPV
jgi:hypothetical protein